MEGDSADGGGGQLDAADGDLGEGLQVEDADGSIGRGGGQEEDGGVVGDARDWRRVTRQLGEQLAGRQVPDLVMGRERVDG